MAISFEFKLTREHLAECFDESLPFSRHQKPKYGFAGSFIGIGMGLILFTEIGGVAPYIMVGLGILEFVSFYYRRPWWLTRQMWSRASNSQVTITLNEDGVHSKNPYTESTLLWEHVGKIIETDKGIILQTEKGAQSYLSRATMPEGALDYIKEQLAVYNVH